MSFFIQGVGAITPLGPNAEKSWAALGEGKRAPRTKFAQPVAGRDYYYCPVPQEFLVEAARQRRLRRSGNISLNGAVAAYDALSDAGIKSAPELGKTLAVVFAICSGGVNYTRRLYNEIISEGAAAASPLLFPETVFNAPASHVASLLSCDEHTYTIVGDSSAGLTAIQFATDLLTCNPSLEYCLIVGAEEGDWVLPDAFNSWRYACAGDHFEVYGRRTGTVFGEGGSAVVVGRKAGIRIAASSIGRPFFSTKDAFRAGQEVIEPMLREYAPDLVVASANGTFADEVEREVFIRASLSCPVYCHKPALGDALGASALHQVVFACLGLRTNRLPGTLSIGARLPIVNRETRSINANRALVTTVGFNQQVNSLVLESAANG